jgi:hypothetical protein
MTAKEKNRLAGIFLMAHGGFLGLMYLLIIGLFAIMFSVDPNPPKVFFGFMMTFIAILATVFVAPQIIGGWKMYKELPNAKNWGIAGAIIACMSMPLGTAAGVFALIFLFGDEGNKFYNNRTNPKYLGEANAVNDFQYNDYREKQPHDWR